MPLTGLKSSKPRHAPPLKEMARHLPQALAVEGSMRSRNKAKLTYR